MAGLFKGLKKAIAAKGGKGAEEVSGPVTKPARRRGGTGKKTLPGTQGTKGPEKDRPGKRRKRGLKMLKSRFGHHNPGDTGVY